MKKNSLYLLCACLTGCSPLKSSPHDQRHQMELTLHEVQTNLDDLRHDIHCFKTELQILDGRIKHAEGAIAKGHDFEKQQTKLGEISAALHAIEKRWSASEKTREGEGEQLRSLTAYAKETSTALAQFKKRIDELERELIAGQRKFEELSKLKGSIDQLIKAMGAGEETGTYKVHSGDSLEKIAKMHKTTAQKIKAFNRLETDRIIVGQELKIPTE